MTKTLIALCVTSMMMGLLHGPDYQRPEAAPRRLLAS